MANFTPNYNLKKPLATEKYNVDDQNGNMDLIDTELKKHATSLSESMQNIETNTNNISAININNTNQNFLNIRGVRYNG